jgi:hypothetical protein
VNNDGTSTRTNPRTHHTLTPPPLTKASSPPLSPPNPVCPVCPVCPLCPPFDQHLPPRSPPLPPLTARRWHYADTQRRCIPLQL